MNFSKTITSIFIVPTLGINADDLSKNGYINGYIDDANSDIKYENVVYLLFKPDDIDRFDNFVRMEFERTKLLIDDYDYDDGYTILIYQLNRKFDKDFNIIKSGRYSKVSDEFKSLFPKVKKIVNPNGLRRDELSLQYKIFNKTGDLIEFWEKQFNISFDDSMEVWYGFDNEKEVLDINKIKEDVKR